MGRCQVYCCVCGGPFLPESARQNTTGKWLTRPIVCTTVHDAEDVVEPDRYTDWMGGEDSSSYGFSLINPAIDSRRHLRQMNAKYGSHDFRLESSGEKVSVFVIWEEGDPFYIALHEACNQIAQHFIESRDAVQDTFQIRPQDEISSLKQLWQVIFARFEGVFDDVKYIPPHPTDYYGCDGLFRCEYCPEDDGVELGQYIEADPIEIPILTQSILDNLEPLSSEYARAISQTSAAIDHSQLQWCNRLTSKEHFPWLWDLDGEKVREKERTGNWDWERLVSKLSQLRIHQLDDTSLNLPLGLRNRRRIWRSIEEARLGDVERQET